MLRDQFPNRQSIVIHVTAIDAIHNNPAGGSPTYQPTGRPVGRVDDVGKPVEPVGLSTCGTEDNSFV